MRFEMLQEVAKKRKLHKRKKAWYRVVSCLAAIVVFCTTYALILPAITMEGEPICGIEDHEHTEECYAMVEGEQQEGEADVEPDPLDLEGTFTDADDATDENKPVTLEVDTALPTFKVQYYAHTNRFATTSSDGDHELAVINTDNPNDNKGNLPVNGKGNASPTDSDIFYLLLEATGLSVTEPSLEGTVTNNEYKVKMIEQLEKLYIDYTQQYHSGLKIYDLDILRDNNHFLLEHIITQSAEQRAAQLAAEGVADTGQELIFTTDYCIKYFFSQEDDGDNEFFFTSDEKYKPVMDKEAGTVTYFYENGETYSLSMEELDKETNQDAITIPTTKEHRIAIYVDEAMTVRFGYHPTEGTQSSKVTFFDYDISNGFIYDVNGGGYSTLSRLTSALGANAQRFMLIYDIREGGALGINHSSNYTSTGAKYAFGNANTGTGLGEETATIHNTSVTFNKEAGVETIVDEEGNRTVTYTTSFYGCSFGLVAGYDLENNKLLFNSQIVAPDLFNTNEENNVKGQNVYSDNWLDFYRNGDTYTLTGVNSLRDDGADDGKIGVSNLDKFVARKSTWITDYYVTSNDFWPVDGLITDTTAGRDILFGDYYDYSSNLSRIAKVEGTTTNNYYQKYGSLPVSDGGEYHNSYFGMNFAVEFTLDGSYTGPLEYLFYGDDDMWVFLTEYNADGTEKSTNLVCDIGGVHGSVGSYTDLWDWIDKGTAGAGKYRLTFFYTERGATGSSCYMQFTIPDAIGVPIENYGALQISKDTDKESDESYKVNVELNADITTSYFVYEKGEDEEGNETTTYIRSGRVSNGKATINLKDNQFVIIDYLTPGVTYKVWESSGEYYGAAWTGGTSQNSENGITYVTGKIVQSETVELQCTNALYGSLTLSKQLEGVASDSAFSFDIQIQMYDADGNPVAGIFKAIHKAGDVETETSVTFASDGTSSKGTLSLKDGESITIKGLPAGVTWTITETSTDGFHVKHQIEKDVIIGETATGTLTNGGNAVTFINESSYVLPDTGGHGTTWYTLGGLVLIGAAWLMYKSIRRKEDIIL